MKFAFFIACTSTKSNASTCSICVSIKSRFFTKLPISSINANSKLSESAISVLNTINDKTDVKFEITKLLAGDIALKETGKALPDETLEAIKKSDVCLKAPVGESAADVIVVLRRLLDLYANIRPAKSYPHMPALRDDIDMVIVRENTEDLYTGIEFSLGNASVALRIISEAASKRIAKYDISETLIGDKSQTPTFSVIMEFPSMEALEKVFKGDKYEKLVPYREKAFLEVRAYISKEQ